MVGTTRETALHIPQPDGDPITIEAEYGAVRQYRETLKMLGGKRNPEVAPYLLASVVESAVSKHVPNEDIVEAAQGLQAADGIVREVPNTPIIYRLHCTDAVGITPDDGTTGFRVVDTSKGRGWSSHIQTAIPVKRLFSVDSGPNFEHDEETSEDADLFMYQPLSFLASDDPEAVSRFIDYDAEWMKYPNSHVIVGHQAVAGFLEAQAKKELLDEEGAVKISGLRYSWAMLASSALRRLGYDSPIGKHGDFVHGVAMEGLANVVGSGLGHSGNIYLEHPYGTDMILRRLSGVDFHPEEDAKVVGEMASELVMQDKDEAEGYSGLLHGDEPHIKSYLTYVAGNFMTHFLDAAVSEA